MNNKHILKGSLLIALGLASIATMNTANKVQAKTYNYRVVTVTRSPFAIVHDSTGKEVYSRALAQNSDWRSDKTITVNGTLYYQVSTDEWVRSEDVEANWDPATGKLKQKLIGKINSTVVNIYYDNGSNIGKDDGRFKFGSAWSVGKVIKNMQGKYFYQVSTNEYISSDDMALNAEPQNVVYQPAFGYVPDKPNNNSGNNTTNNPSNSGNSNSGNNTNNNPSNPGNNNSGNNTTNNPSNPGTVQIAQHESAAAYEQAVVNAINSKRANLGLAPLIINSKLTEAATIRTTEEYNDPAMNENTTGPRPDGSSWWSVLGEVNYDWSFAREFNFLLSDSYDSLTQYNTPEKVAKALMLLYETTGYDQDGYLSPKAKDIGVSIRYSDKAGFKDKIYTVIEVGAQR